MKNISKKVSQDLSDPSKMWWKFFWVLNSDFLQLTRYGNWSIFNSL